MAVSWAYFDTSVLVKRYVEEPGSGAARTLLRRYRFLSSAIAPIEAMSALSRRRATGDLAERDFAAIRLRFLRDREYWELVEVTAAVLDHAEALVQQTALRTLDALHVATALSFQTASGLRVPFVTGNERQRKNASRLEMNVLWVG